MYFSIFSGGVLFLLSCLFFFFGFFRESVFLERVDKEVAG